MDKFVVKLKVAPDNHGALSGKSRSTMKRQATIESLKGVVVIEDIERAKVILKRLETSSDLKISTLEELHKKKPSKEVLLKTEIGKTVRKLRECSDPNVASKAKEVYKFWKEHILSQVNRPSIEVQCDAKTQRMRRRGREMIVGAIRKCLNDTNLCYSLSSEVNVVKESDNSKKDKQSGNSEINLVSLSEHIESEVFRCTRKDLNKSFQRTMRKIIFALTYQLEITSAVVKSRKSVENLVKDFLTS